MASIKWDEEHTPERIRERIDEISKRFWEIYDQNELSTAWELAKLNSERSWLRKELNVATEPKLR